MLVLMMLRNAFILICSLIVLQNPIGWALAIGLAVGLYYIICNGAAVLAKNVKEFFLGPPPPPYSVVQLPSGGGSLLIMRL